MTHKSFLCYDFAFTNLQIICQEIGVKLEPSYIMCDFESSMRKAIKKCFPNAITVGCYFHYCKALWNFFASNDLTSKDLLCVSIKLITFLKILAHIEIIDRSLLFEEISTLFKNKDKKYAAALAYYKKNWLNNYYVESMLIDNKDEQQIARTNNVCKVYNFHLNQKVGIINPRLSILVMKPLDEEESIRNFIMKSTVDISTQPPLVQGFTVSENNIPIGSLSKLLQEKKKSGYNLRTITKDKEFLISCQKIVENCYSTLFLASDVNNDLVDKEEEEAKSDQNDQDNDESNLDQNFTSKYLAILQEEKELYEGTSANEEGIVQKQKSETISSTRKRYVIFINLT